MNFTLDKKIMEHSKVAIAWYAEDEYVKFMESSLDPKTWCNEYESWKDSAQSTLQKLTLEGYIVVKSPMILDDFNRWCDESGSKNDGEGRSSYAAWKLNQ